MINVEVKHHDGKSKLEKYSIFLITTADNSSIEKYIENMQNELTAIFKKWKSVYSIKFYIK